MPNHLRRSRHSSAATIWLLLLTFAIGLWAVQQRAAAQTGQLVTLKVHAPSLASNKLGDPVDQDVAVYLPPSYQTSPRQRFATLYLLHGFGASPQVWTAGGYQGMSLQQSMDALIKAGTIRPMIVVVPNGRNALGGSFYVNSSVTGNWDDFITRDVVSYVDTHYRTIRKAASRGIAGHSMGGYGALTLAMKHPDVFGTVYALSPGILDMQADVSAANPLWSQMLALNDAQMAALETKDGMATILVAVSAAFSPNPRRPLIWGNYPFKEQDGKTVPNEPAYHEWLSQMPIPMLPRYEKNLRRLRGIGFDAGDADGFTHIPLTVRALDKMLTERHIPHQAEIYAGDHGNHIRERLETVVLPFFSRTLQFDDSGK